MFCCCLLETDLKFLSVFSPALVVGESSRWRSSPLPHPLLGAQRRERPFPSFAALAFAPALLHPGKPSRIVEVSRPPDATVPSSILRPGIMLGSLMPAMPAAHMCLFPMGLVPTDPEGQRVHPRPTAQDQGTHAPESPMWSRLVDCPLGSSSGSKATNLIPQLIMFQSSWGLEAPRLLFL